MQALEAPSARRCPAARRRARSARRFVDERFGDRGEDEHRGNDSGAERRGPERAIAAGADRYRAAAMRVWIDLTNSPHVLVMRPVIERLQRGRPRRAGDRARLRPDDRAVRAPGHRAHRDRPPPRRAARGQGRRPRLALGGARALGARRGARAGRRRFDIALGHGSNDVTRGRGAAADPERDDVRLRVGDGPAQRQLPPGARRRRARRDPARSAWRATAPGGKLRALRGPQGGVLPGRLRARPRGARRAGLDPRPADRGRAHAARGLALPPLRERPVRAMCSSACAAPRPTDGVQPVVLPRVAVPARGARAGRPASSCPSARSTPSR